MGKRKTVLPAFMADVAIASYRRGHDLGVDHMRERFPITDIAIDTTREIMKYQMKVDEALDTTLSEEQAQAVRVALSAILKRDAEASAGSLLEKMTPEDSARVQEMLAGLGLEVPAKEPANGAKGRTARRH